MPGATSSSGGVTPVYNKDTGKLEALEANRSGTGKPDTVARMNGGKLKDIEIDRNGDGRPDRWEYYSADGATGASGTGVAIDASTVLVRAEEANGPDPTKITRWEYYDHGVLQRVEEDTNFDGHVDTWETYRDGVLAEMDLDTTGRGKPDRRLIYGANGAVRVEVDRDGSGRFEVVPPAAGGGGR